MITIGTRVRHTVLRGLFGTVVQVYSDRGGLFATVEWEPFEDFPTTTTGGHILESIDTVIAPA